MIRGIYGSTITSFLSLLENKISTVDNSKLRYLFKFTNDMTKTVKYAYGSIISINERVVRQEISHNTSENIFSSRVNFKPYGFWSYEVYEVAWTGTVGVNDTNAPNSETEVLSSSSSNGVVQGKVHEGKLIIEETVGQEQVKYTQHTENTTNYLYTN